MYTLGENKEKYKDKSNVVVEKLLQSRSIIISGK